MEGPWDELGRRRDKNEVMELQTEGNKNAEEKINKLEMSLEKYRAKIEANKLGEEMRNCSQLHVLQVPGSQLMPIEIV